MADTIVQAVEAAGKALTPATAVAQHRTHFAQVLPSHIKADTWVRVAQQALRRGEVMKEGPDRGAYILEVAARNNMQLYLATLLDAARLGLAPGTPAYYLTPRKNKGQWEILGIVGYRGLVELMYRSGAIASVIAETVRANDQYLYRRGVDDTPRHDHPRPFASDEERGKLIGVYAYAKMKDGATSRVVELNSDDIARIKAMNPASAGEYSPWTKWEEAMWLKSGVRRLEPWVPSSPEYVYAQAEVTARARDISTRELGVPLPTDSDTLEGEIAEEWPATAQPGQGGAA